MPTELEKDNKKQLKVNYIQLKGVKNFEPTSLFDAGEPRPPSISASRLAHDSAFRSSTPPIHTTIYLRLLPLFPALPHSLPELLLPLAPWRQRSAMVSPPSDMPPDVRRAARPRTHLSLWPQACGSTLLSARARRDGALC